MNSPSFIPLQSFQTPWSALEVGALIALGAMFVAWLRQVAERNATLVDVVWAALLGVLALFYAALSVGWLPRRIALACVVGAWSARLATHLFVQRVAGHRGVEDGRYAALRAQWGISAQRNFLIFYLAQGALDVGLSLPFALAASNAAAGFALLEYFGLALVALAVIGETLADRQLGAFRSRAENRGRTCRAGLWRYSRHPNYFFEWLAWCGFAALAWPSEHGWLGLASPALMLLLILKVTGIPPTEAQAVRSRGDDYREYQRTTSAFFPWFSKAPSAR